MIAKLVVHAPTRQEAVVKLRRALEDYIILGCTTNLPFLRACAAHPDFLTAQYNTSWIARNISELNKTKVTEALEALLSDARVRQELLTAAQMAGTHAGSQAGTQVFRDASKFGHNGYHWMQPSRLGAMLEASVKAGSHSGEARLLMSPNFARHLGYPLLTELCVWVSRVSPERIEMQVLGEQLSFPCPFWERPSSANSELLAALYAPMAGKVLEVCVNVGQELAEGQVAFVVESMKMQLEVRAPRACKITEVVVKAGQSLNGPDVLALVESVLVVS